jgi:hypothetical protein
MYAIFVAHGPFSVVAKATHHSQSASLRRWFSNPDKGWHSASNETYVMEGFQNVEIYNLVMKLLGIQAQAAKTNGTNEFWDNYL